MTMQREYLKPTTVICHACKHTNVFNQPYPYHAGFGDQGFLYNDKGDLTLVWSAFDPSYENIVGKKNPWVLSDKDKQKLENALLPAPHGGAWKFSNPPRCTECGNPIGSPIEGNIYYFEYDGSVVVDCPTKKDKSLESQLRTDPSTSSG